MSDDNKGNSAVSDPNFDPTKLPGYGGYCVLTIKEGCMFRVGPVFIKVFFHKDKMRVAICAPLTLPIDRMEN